MSSKRPELPKSPFHKSFADCDRPACEDTVSAISKAMERVTSAQQQQRTGETANSAQECPPNKAALGNSSWTLLHSMAAYYPDSPSHDDRKLMTNFFSAIAKFYPCSYCAEDFQQNLNLKPPRTQSRKDLCVWLCQQHNLVNEKLGKPVFKCDLPTLDERWRKSQKDQCQQQDQ